MTRNFFYKMGMYNFLAAALLNCGDFSIRKDPFLITVGKYENMSSVPAFLAHSGDSCTNLMYKRIYHFFFMFPLNGYSEDEKKLIGDQNMIRYKTVLRSGDILWNLLLLLTIRTHSVEIDTCPNGLVFIPKHELDHLKRSARDRDDKLKSQENTLEKSSAVNEQPSAKKGLDSGASKKAVSESVVSAENSVPTANMPPILTNYKKAVLQQYFEEDRPYTVFFHTNISSFPSEENKKLDKFASEYKEKYSKYNILILGHIAYTESPPNNLDLSIERAKSVRNYLLSKDIPSQRIHIISSGGTWPENNEEKQGKEFGRRADILLMN